MANPWVTLGRLIEAMESDNDRPRMQRMPPPVPGSQNRAPRSFLPGVHDPASPQRPGKRAQKMGEGPMPTMPQPGASNMPSTTPSNTGGEEEEMEEGGLNWAKHSRQRNIQRWGTEKGRMSNADAMERSMRAMKAGSAEPTSEMPPRMTPRQGGLSDIPAGRDAAPQANPLLKPSAASLSHGVRPRSGWEELLDTGADEEP